jgi:hypothetical protein
VGDKEEYELIKVMGKPQEAQFDGIVSEIQSESEY